MTTKNIDKVKQWMKNSELTIKSADIDGELSVKTKPIQENGYRTITDNNGLIIDYLDVKIAGYASKYGVDREGEEMMQGAFGDGLKTYMKNAVMTYNHDRTSKDAGVGKFVVAFEDKKGLVVEGEISNAPGLRDLRFKVVEGIIKAMSVGGRFTMEFGKNFVKIHKVATREIALCTVPACEGALFKVKSESNDLESPENMAAQELDCDMEINEVEIDGKVYKIIESEE